MNQILSTHGNPISEPLLASDIKKRGSIKFPVLASPKFDGIRALVVGTTDGAAHLMSRHFKLIPNVSIQQTLARKELRGLDGEIVTYTDGKMDDFHTVQSKVMTSEGDPDFVFHVFDLIDRPSDMFVNRLAATKYLVSLLDITENLPIVYTPHTRIYNDFELTEYENLKVGAGFEGVMLRSPQGPYKFGRSTEDEGILLKLKRFVTEEAYVIGYLEEMQNNNPQQKDNLGKAKRSSHKANKRPKGRVGALICKPFADGPFTEGEVLELSALIGDEEVEKYIKAHPSFFLVGSGFTADQRWEFAKECPEVITFKHQPHGRKIGGKPRTPIFLGVRIEQA